MNKRIDWLMRQQVDVGIQIANESGTQAGARHMFERGVPLHVALRVLRRRA